MYNTCYCCQVLRKLVFSPTKLYNTLALPVLLYGSESWTIKARDARRITAAVMTYMRRTAEYTWTDHKTNTQIAKEFKITAILDKLQEYKRNWIHHVNRMPRNRLPMVMKQYFPSGRRNNGRPLKRLVDTWDRNGSTSGQIPWQIDDDNDHPSTVHYFIKIISSQKYSLFLMFYLRSSSERGLLLTIWRRNFLLNFSTPCI